MGNINSPREKCSFHISLPRTEVTVCQEGESVSQYMIEFGLGLERAVRFGRLVGDH